jgi:hypothetical protein
MKNQVLFVKGPQDAALIQLHNTLSAPSNRPSLQKNTDSDNIRKNHKRSLRPAANRNSPKSAAWKYSSYNGWFLL